MINRTPTTIRRAALPLAAAGLALLLAACGSAHHNPPTNAGKRRSPATLDAAAYKHAECMRSHGVPNFPNPEIINTPTKHGIRQAVPQGVAESPQFKVAQNACKGILPEPHNGGPSEGGHSENAGEQRAHAQTLLAFAHCLRSHGVQGFPDPNAQGQLTLTMIHAAGIDLQAPSLLVAAKACVGVTHGAITLAQVEQAIHHPGDEQPSRSETASAHPSGK